VHTDAYLRSRYATSCFLCTANCLGHL
jgi:hypothetical protein